MGSDYVAATADVFGERQDAANRTDQIAYLASPETAAQYVAQNKGTIYLPVNEVFELGKDMLEDNEIRGFLDSVLRFTDTKSSGGSNDTESGVVPTVKNE